MWDSLKPFQSSYARAFTHTGGVRTEAGWERREREAMATAERETRLGYDGELERRERYAMQAAERESRGPEWNAERRERSAMARAERESEPPEERAARDDRVRARAAALRAERAAERREREAMTTAERETRSGYYPELERRERIAMRRAEQESPEGRERVRARAEAQRAERRERRERTARARADREWFARAAESDLVAQTARLRASAERVMGMWDSAAERAMGAMDAAAEAATSFDGGAWAAENGGAWTDATATAASGVPPDLAIEDTEAWINSGMARWN